MNKFNHFEARQINPLTARIAVTEQIVMSRAELEQKLVEARIDELKRFEWNDAHMYVHTRIAELESLTPPTGRKV